jgi:hypothetical protein
MVKALYNVKISKNLLDYILPVKNAFAQQNAVVGVTKYLENNKQANSGVKFVKDMLY